MLIGSEFYGNKKEFQKEVTMELENDKVSLMRKQTQMDGSQYVDPNTETGVSWRCENFTRDMN